MKNTQNGREQNRMSGRRDRVEEGILHLQSLINQTGGQGKSKEMLGE